MKALPEMAEEATAEELSAGFEEHLEQSKRPCPVPSADQLGNDRLARDSWEQQTLCCAIVRHLKKPLCLHKHCLVNMFVREEASFCLHIRELSRLVSASGSALVLDRS